MMIRVERLILITFASLTFLSLFLTFDFNTVAKRFAFPDTLLNPTKVTVFYQQQFQLDYLLMVQLIHHYMI